MPAEDPWDNVDMSDMKQFSAADLFGAENVAIGNAMADQELLLWLVNMMSGKDLWMDGTMHWSLPLSVLSGIRARTAMDAIKMAHKRHLHGTNKSC